MFDLEQIINVTHLGICNISKKYGYQLNDDEHQQISQICRSLRTLNTAKTLECSIFIHILHQFDKRFRKGIDSVSNIIEAVIGCKAGIDLETWNADFVGFLDKDYNGRRLWEIEVNHLEAIDFYIGFKCKGTEEYNKLEDVFKYVDYKHILVFEKYMYTERENSSDFGTITKAIYKAFNPGETKPYSAKRIATDDINLRPSKTFVAFKKNKTITDTHNFISSGRGQLFPRFKGRNAAARLYQNRPTTELRDLAIQNDIASIIKRLKNLID